MMLLKKIYGLKNSAKVFRKEFLKSFNEVVFKRSNTDPCMYYKWTALGMLVWLSYIDYCE